MVAFTFYAMLVGYWAVHWRRRLIGYLGVALLVGVLVLLAWVHYQIPRLAAQGWKLAQDINIRPFQAVLYPYIGCVSAMGLFLVSLPRKRPIDSCWYCRYDLSALLDEPGVLICPECGREHVSSGSPRYRKSGLVRAALRSSDVVVPTDDQDFTPEPLPDHTERLQPTVLPRSAPVEARP
ncbi:MAG: hypothetical protein Kow0022_02020 [Phycisphaerales bacterium]